MTPDTNAHRGSRAPLYTVPTNPGGSKWERNTPPPIGVCYRHSRQSFGVAVRCLTDYLRAGSPRESRPLSSGSRGALLTRSLGYSTQTSTQRSHTHIYARSHARTHASPHTPCCLLSHPTHTIANKSLAGCSISPRIIHSFIHISHWCISSSPDADAVKQLRLEGTPYRVRLSIGLVWFAVRLLIFDAHDMTRHDDKNDTIREETSSRYHTALIRSRQNNHAANHDMYTRHCKPPEVAALHDSLETQQGDDRWIGVGEEENSAISENPGRHSRGGHLQYSIGACENRVVVVGGRDYDRGMRRLVG